VLEEVLAQLVHVESLDLMQIRHIRRATSGQSVTNEEALSWGISPVFLKSFGKTLGPWWRISGALKRGVEYTFHP
jgi:hypothetical protein